MNSVFAEIKAIGNRWPMWFMLGNQDIKLKYRRSSIGPFWITISMAVTVYTMGFLYGHLFKVDLTHYYPHLASGIIAWSLISALIIESTGIFIESEGCIRNQESFMSLFMMRLILRNTIVFFHNLLVFVPIVIIFHVGIGPSLLLMIPGLAILMINTVLWGTLLAFVGTRYRDFAQIVGSLVQVIFFMTPIMWSTNSLPERFQWVVTYNPFNQFLNLVRAPMLNQVIGLSTMTMVASFTVVGFGLYYMVMRKYKHRIVFWL